VFFDREREKKQKAREQFPEAPLFLREREREIFQQKKRKKMTEKEQEMDLKWEQIKAPQVHADAGLSHWLRFPVSLSPHFQQSKENSIENLNLSPFLRSRLKELLQISHLFPVQLECLSRLYSCRFGKGE
jgi:hypothetical protein